MLYTPQEIDMVLSTLGEVLTADLLEHIRSNYAGEGRHYHTFDHAIEVLSWVNRACEEYYEEDLQPFTYHELRLAALLHDVVYTTAGSPQNEAESCEWVQRELANVVPPDSMARISQLIMLTAEHGKLSATEVPLAGRLLLDADLANLGRHQWEVFVYNDSNVVAELRLKYTAEQILVGRKAFLSGFLAKESIFLSPFFRMHFEVQARRNITRLLGL